MAYPILLAHGVCRFDRIWCDALDINNNDDPQLDRLHYFKKADGDNGATPDAWMKRVASAFSSSQAAGLFALAATRPDAPPPREPKTAADVLPMMRWRTCSASRCRKM